MMSFDYRHFENRLERMARIIFDGKARIVDAVNLHEFSRSAINRAITALENKRKVGKTGHTELLTDEEKKTVEEVIRCESSSGVSISVSQMKQLMESVISDRQKDLFEEEKEEVEISKSSPYSFIKRNPQLKVSLSINVDIQQLSVSNKQTLQRFYNLLQNLHDTNNCSTSLIFNTDESSLRLSDSAKKLVVHPSDTPAGFNKTPMNMPNATLCITAAADGFSLKSIVLWPSKKIPAELRVMLSSSINIWEDNDGWMTDAIFRMYAEDVLLPGIVERRTLLEKEDERCLLLLDSHPSRAQPDIWQKFSDASIDVVTFIPHSAHLTQPFDHGVFVVFKKCFNTDHVVLSSSSVSLQRKAIADALPQALQTSLLPVTIISSFVKSGVLSNQWHSVLSSLPDEPSVALKKRNHRFDFHGKIITMIIWMNGKIKKRKKRRKGMSIMKKLWKKTI
ncbi:putative DDE superfamily endonuclease [Monocercomonoides exilis]|uniref:putative DDE superfamily endonuclease n=1 Tax=Monocercomonoides exilis TaxID=2049356 RepID=UPI00355A6EF6|nr:putative DDE superfamily endonuclease [Monocercomonoides exilis]|eukprot:MONOS_16147.1-p1 / transcript=MONOS_16147.1 / gene=MONOS_16147 / organism=Monocercomonoides_exilis_PA203 / gene_product=unspecified product / transcript_product=unspecified product / location=Mono_scaffold01529:5784-7185(-) / protein_length=449 / sequence_SO=supercontig / SO=protein_coding / is_pseudo=false